MSNTNHSCRSVCTGSALSVTSSADAAAYTFTQIDVPFAGASDTNIFGINDLGQVVGRIAMPFSIARVLCGTPREFFSDRRTISRCEQYDSL